MKWPLCALTLLISFPVLAADLKIERFQTDASLGRSGAVRVEQADLIYSGQIAAPTAGELFDRTEVLLRAVGLKLDDVVKLNMALAKEEDHEEVLKVLKDRFQEKSLPAVSWVTSALPEPEKKPGEKKTAEKKPAEETKRELPKAVIALDFVAARAASPQSRVMPSAVDGQRPLAVIPAAATSRVYVSGQAEKGDGSIGDATKQTMASLLKTLKFLELSAADVVQVKAFIAPMSKSSDVTKEIREAFAPLAAPPIVLVEWESSSQPVEIELMAATRNPLPQKRPVVEYLTPPEMKSSPVYSKVVRVQSPVTIFISGLFGTQSDPDSEAELRDLFAQTKSLAEAAGSDLKHLVKATYYVSAKGSSDQHNKLRPEYYDPARPPAASKAMVKGVGRAGRTITWDVIAAPKE
jgi:enamine deaminase RidA (YjgF/YER057c/UK114 family)